MRPTSALGAVVAALAASLWSNLLFPSAPIPSDADVAELGARFEGAVHRTAELSTLSRGSLCRDRDTFFWSLFTDIFGRWRSSQPFGHSAATSPRTLLAAAGLTPTWTGGNPGRAADC